LDNEREHPRLPYAVQVQFRTASSFLVAYSVNLSRGGMFVETEADIPAGSPLTVELAVPGIGTTQLQGIAVWRRGREDASAGPPGIGVELADVAPQLGAVIDKLASNFRGVQVLVLSGDRQDRTTLARSIKSIFSTAEITQAVDAQTATRVLTHEVDVAIVDVDFDLEGALTTIRTAKAQQPPVPTIAITSNANYRERAVEAGCDELLANPPPFADLQVVLVRALGKPVSASATITG